jgi:TPR repeat protein
MNAPITTDTPTQFTNNSVEYFATSTKKILWLSFLTAGWYSLRWFLTNYHRYVQHKYPQQHNLIQWILTLLMGILSIIFFLPLVRDIHRQCRAAELKPWWRPNTLYVMLLAAQLLMLPGLFPGITVRYPLPWFTYLTTSLLTTCLLAFIMSTLQQAVNHLNQQRVLRYKTDDHFGGWNWLAVVLAPLLWGTIAMSSYYRALPVDALAELYLKQGNYHEAFFLLKPAADAGDSRAALVVGALYAEGMGITKDNNRALYYFNQASRSKDPRILTITARYYLRTQSDPQAGLNLLKKAADQNFAPAQNQLSVLYATGKRIPSNYQQAFYYAQTSAKQKDAEGEFLLAVLYHDNPEQQPNWSHYVHYLTQAAEQSFAPAAYYLGLEYRRGNPVLAKDMGLAVKWFKVAAKKQDPQAMTELANAYESGVGIAQDKKKAAALYLAAAQQNNAVAQYKIGLAYAFARGVPRDYREAINWLTQAAQQKMICANNELGMLYAQGHGVGADEESAKNYFHLAAEQGYLDALKMGDLQLLSLSKIF